MTPSSVLRHAGIYVLFQRAVGADRARSECIRALTLRAGERIVDVGCGPAYYLSELPDVDYHGFDTDRSYVEWARRRWGPRGTFHSEPFDQRHAERLAPIDGVMLMGLLHHLDDDDANRLLELVARSLSKGGRVVSLDTVLFPGQSAFSRFLAKHDRGDFVRSPRDFERVAARHFAEVDTCIVGDTLRMPSAHFRMVLRAPK